LQKSIPKGGSLVGEHRLGGEGIPASVQFTVTSEQDILPAISLQTMGTLQDSIGLSWITVAHARAYYLHAMSAQGQDVVLWSSSENGDAGMGLFDYLSNATIDQWTKDKVLLGAEVTQCRIPKGILGAQKTDQSKAFLGMMAYGGEHTWVHPPRPTDPRATWEQEWAVRLRVKAHTMAMLGQDTPAEAGLNPAPDAEEKPAKKAKPSTILPINPFNLLRGLFGR
jgi:hypothetical protein